MSAFTLATLAAWAAVVALAALLRSRSYAAFRLVMLGLHSWFAIALYPRFAWAWPAFVYLHATVYLHSLALIRPRMRSLAYRALVSIPSAFFAAGTFLALPWVVVGAFGVALPAPWLAYLAAGVGVVQSLGARREDVDIVVRTGSLGSEVQRCPHGAERVERPLRIAQITDPHLGPFMSVERLAGICERVAASDPDLVFLTGDFLTMESQADPTLLERALGPLAALRGRVFACRGNHDHEAPLTVARAMQSIGARLLIDDAVTVETDAGLVQVVGVDFAWRNRRAHLEGVSEAHPRVDDALRIVLLHDPGAFKHLPPGDADLVLSGHTHGGQVGLVSLGLPWTMLRVLMNAPDHGFWGRGTDRLYVHRGTGHYGFPLRLGVPAEESLVRVHVGATPKR